VVQRIVRDSAIKRLAGQRDGIEIANEELRLVGKTELPRFRLRPLNPCRAEINCRHLKAALSKFDREVSLAASKFQHIWTARNGSLEKMPVFRAEKNLKEPLIMPDLRIFRIWLDLIPML
jgi:hypothetical protein